MTALLAIDPGATSGLAVLTLEPRPRLLHSETHKFTKAPETPSQVVSRLLAAHPITSAVVEDQYQEKNVQSLKKLARISGRWEEACKVAGLQVVFIYPSTWQSKVLKGVARKRAELKQAARMVAASEVGRLLPENEADAFLIGRYVAVGVWYDRLTKDAH